MSNIIDIHTHAFPETVAGKAIETLETASVKHGITACGDGTLQSLRGSMERAGIGLSVVQPVATTAEQVESINRYAAAHNRPEDGIAYFGALHPEHKGYEAEIEKLKQAGIQGIKLHPEFQHFAIDSPVMLPVYEAIAEAGMLVMMHMGLDLFARCEGRATPGGLARVLERVPGLRVIAAHGGGFRQWDEFIEKLAGHERVWIDLAFIPGYIPERSWRVIYERHGWRKILFGTDYPWMAQETVKDFVTGLGLPREEEEGILGKNARHLLQL